MEKEKNKNAVVVSTFTTIFNKKGTKNIYIDKSSYGFIATSFTEEEKKEMTKILKQGMAEKLKECYGEELEKLFSKIEFRVSFRVTEVDAIIG